MRFLAWTALAALALAAPAAAHEAGTHLTIGDQVACAGPWTGSVHADAAPAADASATVVYCTVPGGIAEIADPEVALRDLVEQIIGPCTCDPMPEPW